MSRRASLNRVTKETAVQLELRLDGGDTQIDTPVGFLNHMLELFAHHSGFGLKINATGDTYIDDHHSVEDIGIVLGKALYEAAGDKLGIARYGHCVLPMDEALVEVALDFGGRAYLHCDLPFAASKCGSFDLQLIEEFFRALASNAKMTLHIMKRHGANDHHVAEAAFKAVARALKAALAITSDALPSSKGVLE
ncbi:MAG: imidazoleglycerol-phosphate dehydratase HisB [Deferribacteraceae bacterium]|jgi:imidazoleglycerol-phosphate dehydratase|nr:imidazoleglycerol-phosphate dehydratase HisB [Deferribacteraceae bacterium]